MQLCGKIFYRYIWYPVDVSRGQLLYLVIIGMRAMGLLIYNQFKAIFVFVMNFFSHSTSSCKRDYECEFSFEDYKTKNLFYRFKWVFFSHSTCSCKRDYECEFPLENYKTNNLFLRLKWVLFYIQPVVVNVSEYASPRELWSK